MRAGDAKPRRRAVSGTPDPPTKLSRPAKTTSSTAARTRAIWARLRRAQIRLPYVFVLFELFRVVRERDFARLQHVAATGDVEGHQSVLLDEQDRRPLRVDL